MGGLYWCIVHKSTKEEEGKGVLLCDRGYGLEGMTMDIVDEWMDRQMPTYTYILMNRHTETNRRVCLFYFQSICEVQFDRLTFSCFDVLNKNYRINSVHCRILTFSICSISLSDSITLGIIGDYF